MKIGVRLVCMVLVALPLGLAQAQSGDKVEHIPLPNPDIPIAAAVVVPAGYDTIYDRDVRRHQDADDLGPATDFRHS